MEQSLDALLGSQKNIDYGIPDIRVFAKLKSINSSVQVKKTQRLNLSIGWLFCVRFIQMSMITPQCQTGELTKIC
jgi:hypothetical protein